jgi:hypothetical protein
MHNKFVIAGALYMIIAGALVAHAINVPGSPKPTVHAVVSPFGLMLKAKDLPVESFDTV